MDLLISQSRLPVQWNPASLPFFLAAALSAWLVVLAWGRRNEPSAPPLISLLLFEGLWALCEAIEAVLLDPSAQAVIYRLKLSSVALVPPSLLFFVLEYTSRTGAAPAALQGADPRGAGDLHQPDRDLRGTPAVPRRAWNRSRSGATDC